MISTTIIVQYVAIFHIYIYNPKIIWIPSFRWYFKKYDLIQLFWCSFFL